MKDPIYQDQKYSLSATKTGSTSCWVDWCGTFKDAQVYQIPDGQLLHSSDSHTTYMHKKA